jgi:hypothetical protein
MEEQNVRIRMTRNAFVDGKAVQVNNVLNVTERTAKELFAIGKAVPAGKQEKSKGKHEAEEKARLEAEEKARLEAEEKARLEEEARHEAEEKARLEAGK